MSLPLTPPDTPTLTVVSIAEGGAGRGYDLTDQVEGLGYSNVNPGGDEVATFTVHRPWYDDSPDLARGNLLRICNGIDVLWQGRIEESDRGADNSETIAVTAYGLGVRAKDGNFREIFIDCDLSKWGEPSAQRKINLISANRQFQGSTSIVGQDSGASGPGILHQFSRIASNEALPFAFVASDYFGGGIALGEFRYDGISVNIGASALWDQIAYGFTDDVGSAFEAGVDHSSASAENQLLRLPPGYYYLELQTLFHGTFTGDGEWAWLWRYPKVLGRHSLSPQGTWPNIGFTVDQMVRYIIEQVPGITPRRIDGQSFIVQQATYTSPTSHEDGIRDLNRFENCDWGTWGPDSPLDNSTDGYFDFTDQDLTTQHWFVLRQSCDAEDLHSETATLYGKVDVVYTDEAEIERVVRVEVDVPDLDSAGLSRTYTLSIGQATETIARAEGEAFLNVWGQFAPARGTFTVSQPVRHYQRGMLSPLYMRADGANVRIPDILPASTLFALDATPDRRTTFPIKRVSVDCSGAEPQATVEVDQADDALSVLQARSDLKTSLIPA